MRELKDILRELRAEHEMTQDDLARQIGAVGMVSEPPANRSCMENIIYLLSHLVTRHKKGGGSAPGSLAAAKTSARLRRRFLHVIRAYY